MRYLNNPGQCISYANACSSFLMGKLHYHLWDEVCNATDLKHYFEVFLEKNAIPVANEGSVKSHIECVESEKIWLLNFMCQV